MLIINIAGQHIGHIDQQKNKLKIGFPIVFSNLARKGLGGSFHARALIFSPNALYLPTKQP